MIVILPSFVTTILSTLDRSKHSISLNYYKAFSDFNGPHYLKQVILNSAVLLFLRRPIRELEKRCSRQACRSDNNRQSKCCWSRCRRKTIHLCSYQRRIQESMVASGFRETSLGGENSFTQLQVSARR